MEAGNSDAAGSSSRGSLEIIEGRDIINLREHFGNGGPLHPSRADLARAGVAGAGAAAAGITVWTLLDKLSAEQLVDVLQSPLAGYLLIIGGLLYITHSFGRRFIPVQEQMAENFGRLAAGVERVAERDDQRAREQELLLNHLTRNSERLLQGQTEIMGLIKKFHPEAR